MNSFSVNLCGHATIEQLAANKHLADYGLVADATTAVWTRNSNPNIYKWIVENLKDKGSVQIPPVNTVFATIIYLSSCVSDAVACESVRLERIAEFIREFNTSAEMVMTPSHFWEIVTYHQLPIQPFLQFLLEISVEVGLGPTVEQSMWLWTAAWENGNHELAAWLTDILGIRLGTLPDCLRTICVFRKPLRDEIVQSIPVSHVARLIKTIAADASVHNISIEVVGGYRSVQLQWELPDRPRYALRTNDVDAEAYQLRQHVEHSAWYAPPAAAVKLLWLGIPPSFEEHLNIALETIDSIGCTFFAVDGYRNEASSDDANKLIITAALYADRALHDSFHKRRMMEKLLQPRPINNHLI